MQISIHQLLNETILSDVTDQKVKVIMSLVIIALGFFVFSIIFDRVLRTIMVRLINKLMLLSKNDFLTALAATKIFDVISLISFPIVFDVGSAFVSFKGDDAFTQGFASFMVHAAYFGYFFVSTLILVRIISGINHYYERKFDGSGEYPIYGYIKMLQFSIWCVGIVLYLSYVMNKSPLTTLTGIGAVSAIFLLIFKDTFLGLVSSIQATANHIVKLGDWVNIPKYNIDGEVIYISISSVKVRNWDNIVTSIPTFSLTSDAIHNWQKMVESKARRIFRAVYIDISSIQACDSLLLASLTLKYPYVAKLTNGMDESVPTANLALYRMYLNDYLQNNPLLNHDHPNLARYLAPTPTGVPLQIYAFSLEVYLAEFEETQSQIFEHLFLTLPDFGLRIFQSQSVGMLNS